MSKRIAVNGYRAKETGQATPMPIEDAQTVGPRLREARENYMWADKNYARLRRKYANQFVAIEHQRVIDHDLDARVLGQRVRGRKSKTNSVITVQYITTEDYDTIL